MRIFALVAAALLTVTACQTTENIGSGPVSNMSYKTVNAYRNYLLTMEDYSDHNFAFVYDSATQGYGWAGKLERHGMDYAIEAATENCRNGSPGADCKVLDINGRIVWMRMDGNVYARLQQNPPKSRDSKIHDYDPQAYRISTSQLKDFKSRTEFRKDFSYSAFFVSSDRKTVGEGHSTGSGTGALSATIRNARQDCQIGSPEKKCFLFATNGEPINEDARRALERDN